MHLSFLGFLSHQIYAQNTLSINKTLNSTSHFVDFIWQIRKWESEHFPLSQGRILFDALIYIKIHDQLNKKLTVKELQFSLPYSARGIRYALEKLISEGWCEIKTSTDDRRLKYISGTEKLITIFNTYEMFFHSELEKLRLDMHLKPLISEDELEALLCINENFNKDQTNNSPSSNN